MANVQRAPEWRPDDCEAKFWAVFEHAPDAYLLLAIDAPRFTMLAANEARLRATMTRREDVIGKPLFEVFPDNPTDPSATGVRNLEDSLREVLRTRKPHRMALQQYDIRRPDGEFEQRYWDPLNVPVLDEHGDLIYIIHRVEDVTEEVLSARQLERETEALAQERRARKQLEGVLDKLRQSEERYRLLTDMIPQNVWISDAHGRHTFFSRRWYDYTKATPEASHGEGWLEWIHPDDKARTIASWQHSLDTGEPYEIEYRFRDPEGGYRWFLGKAMPRRDRDGTIVEWFGTATDISVRKKLEEERERLLESRAALMRGFSHDVRNPLTVADMSAQLLEFSVSSDEDREGVQRIRRSIRTSLRLLDDILDVARIEAGQLDLQCRPTDVHRVAREVTADFSVPASAAGVELSSRAPEGLQADTDEGRMRQVLGNLLSNAVKYAPKSRVTVDAEVRHSGGPRPGEWIAVTVTDGGPGIAEDKREAIFQEYTRLDPDAQQGTGIGLAISRRIARLLGGDLTVESELGRGSTFVLWLPPAKPQAAATTS